MSLPTNISDATPTLDPVLDHAQMHNAENALINAHDTKLSDVPVTVGTSIASAIAASMPTIQIAESQVTGLVSDLAAKAPLSSPTFTGHVTVPTPTSTGDSATKSYVDGLTSANSTSISSLQTGKLSSLGVTVAKTANFTALTNTRYNVDTTGGSVTMTLPATATKGDIIFAQKSDATGNILYYSGTINGASTTTFPNRTQTQGKLLEWDGTSSWNVIAGDLSLATLDGRYLQTATGISGYVAAGTNVTITGTGTTASPYTVSASGGGSGSDPTKNQKIDSLASIGTFENGDFENGSASLTLGSDYSISTDFAYSGTHSLKQVSTANYSDVLFDPIPVPSNTSCTITFYSKVSATGNTPKFQINAPSPYSNELISAGDYTIPTSSGFQLNTITFNSGANTAVYPRIYNNNGPVTAYYDFFNLTTTSSPRKLKQVVAKDNTSSKRGGNLIGLEFGYDPNNYSNTVLPGVAGTNYFLPYEDDARYLAGKGFKSVRLTYIWERIQPTVGGALDTTYLGYIQSSVTLLNKYGLNVLLDMQNFGGRYISGVMHKIGDGTLTNANFADVYTKISNVFKSNPLVSYDLMNEPNGMPTSTTTSNYNTTASWTTAAQAAINAIRATGDTNAIYVETDNSANARRFFLDYGGNPWTDSGNNLYLSFHAYFDSDNSGNYNSTTGQTLVASGHAVHYVGDILDNLAYWCTSNGYKMHVGEMGIPGTDKGYMDALEYAITTIEKYSFDWHYWAFGRGYVGVSICAQPSSDYLYDAPQMRVMAIEYSPMLPTTTAPDATTTSKGVVQLAGDLTGTATSPALTATGTAGTYGGASAIPVITTDSKGRVTSVTTTAPATQTATGAAGGDLTGTYPNPTLATVNSNVGSFGSASSVMTQTVNAKGLTTAAASVPIQITESQVTSLVTDLAGKQPNVPSSTSQTASFSAVPNMYYPVNATSAAITATLPATNTVGQQIGIKKTDVSTNIVSVSGTINGTASSTLPLRLQDQGKVFIGDGTGNWNVYSGDLSLATTDARYLQNITGLVTAGTNVTVTGSGTAASPYVVASSGSGSAPDATTTSKGIVQLAGDLGGTAASPTVPTKVNKAGDTMTGDLIVGNGGATHLSVPGSSTGSNNQFFGDGAGNATLTGMNNVGLGHNTFAALTSGSYNMAIGSGTLSVDTTGERNSVIGAFAMDANTTGSNNVALGQDALGANISGGSNLAIGNYSLLNTTAGFNNVAVGQSSLESSTGNDNTSVGFQAAKSLTTGASNVFLGEQAGFSETTGSGSVMLGYKSGYNETAGNSFYISNIQQSSLANDKAYSLLYGTFSGTAASLSGQALTINGGLNLNGSVTISDAKNVIVGSTTGTIIATATTQKVGFWNTTPIVQPTATTELGTVLSSIGLRAAGTAYPITTSGAITFTATSIATDTATGLKIGTSTTQKLAFFGATPIVKGAAYSLTGGTPSRTLALGSATATTLFNLINAVVNDLQALGLLS